MKETKYITIMFVPDGTEARRGFRMRHWLFKTILSVCSVLIVGLILFFIFYGSILSKAARAGELEEENKRLLKYHYKVQLLEENLKQTRDIVERLTDLAGIDIELPEIPPDSVLFSQIDNQGGMLKRNEANNWEIPSGLPLAGFISQDFEIEDRSKYHPGIDLACAEGTPVLATAAGKVIYASVDSTYGEMVVLKHNDTVTSVYGHNSELLVNVGDEVPVGGRIALSGNTGKSTAPHLHYEVRINDESINPMEMK